LVLFFKKEQALLADRKSNRMRTSMAQDFGIPSLTLGLLEPVAGRGVAAANSGSVKVGAWVKTAWASKESEQRNW
jgi:hypothetical protein